MLISTSPRGFSAAAAPVTQPPISGTTLGHLPDRLSAKCPRSQTLLVLGSRTGDKHQSELADLDLVAVAEGRRLHPLAVDIGAVEAADVTHGEDAALAMELGMPPGDGDIVEEDVAVG